MLGTINYQNEKTGESITENLPNVVVSSVRTNVGELKKNTDGTYDGNIELDENPVTVTITAEWISNGDEIDTTIGYTPLNITIPVTVVVEQDT